MGKETIDIDIKQRFIFENSRVLFVYLFTYIEILRCVSILLVHLLLLILLKNLIHFYRI